MPAPAQVIPDQSLSFIEEYRLYRLDIHEREREIRRALADAWERFLPDGDEGSYDSTVGEIVASFSSDGSVRAALRAKPLAKELMAAERLAANGHDVLFLPTRSGYRVKGPDLVLDGRCEWDVKRMESRNRNKVFQRLREGAGQAGRVILDVTLGTISVADAVEMSERAMAAGGLGLDEVIVLDPWSQEPVVR